MCRHRLNLSLLYEDDLNLPVKTLNQLSGIFIYIYDFIHWHLLILWRINITMWEFAIERLRSLNICVLFLSLVESQYFGTLTFLRVFWQSVRVLVKHFEVDWVNRTWLGVNWVKGSTKTSKLEDNPGYEAIRLYLEGRGSFKPPPSELFAIPS